MFSNPTEFSKSQTPCIIDWLIAWLLDWQAQKRPLVQEVVPSSDVEENGVQDAVRRRRPSPKLQQGESARSWISFVDCWCGCLSLLSLLVGDVSFVVVAVAVIVGGGVVHAVVVWYWVVITFMLSLLSYATPAHEKKKTKPFRWKPAAGGRRLGGQPPAFLATRRGGATDPRGG